MCGRGPSRSIWIDNPSDELKMLRAIKSNLKGECGKCDYRELCGGCRQKAYYYNGDLLAEDPTCIVERKYA